MDHIHVLVSRRCGLIKFVTVLSKLNNNNNNNSVINTLAYISY